MYMIRLSDAVVSSSSSSPLSFTFLLPKGRRTTTLGSNHATLRSSIKFRISKEGKLASAIKPKLRHLLPPLQNQITDKRSMSKVAVKASDNHEQSVRQPEENRHSIATVVLQQLDAFRRFSRDYTVFGSIAAITSVSLVPVIKMGYFPPTFLSGYLQALIVGIALNIYIVGLNQLYDVEIDKVNKPHLPLASGEYSMTTGIILVAFFGVVSFVMAYVSGSHPLMYFTFVVFLLGSAYSIDAPFLRWKQNPLLAAFVIVSWRSILIPNMFFWHMQEVVIKKPLFWAKPVIFATAIMFFFGTVIALFKDIPDVEGDRKNGIQSLTILLGQKTVFWLSIKLMMIGYGAAMVAGTTCPSLPCRIISVLGHAILASLLWSKAHSLETKDKKSIYMFIWKLFYAEYILVPFMQ